MKRGWFRRATVCIKDGAKSLWLQAVIWKDKKVLGLLSTAFITDEVETKARRRRRKEPIHLPCPNPVRKYQQHYNKVDARDRSMSDWDMSIKTQRWYMTIVFYALSVVVRNMYLIASEWIKQKKPGYEAYGLWKSTLVSRMSFQMALAKAMLTYAETEAVKAAAGDRSKVAWLKRKPGRRSSDVEAPRANPGTKPKHTLIPLPSRPFCQVCREIAGLHLPASGDLPDLCSRRGVGICKACDKVMCSYCEAHNWSHGYSRLCKGTDMPPAKRGKLKEELEDNKPLV